MATPITPGSWSVCARNFLFSSTPSARNSSTPSPPSTCSNTLRGATRCFSLGPTSRTSWKRRDPANLELSFNEVFDGPGVEGVHLLDGDQLRAISPEQMLEARLVAVPCLRLLALRYPVHTYFTAVRRHEEPDVPEPAETYLAITRRRYVVRHYELSPPAYQLLHALLAGESVGQAISRAVEAAGPDLDRLPYKLWRWFH